MAPDTPAETRRIAFARLAAKPFVGRRALTEAARASLVRTGAGRGASVVLSGEPGIGKTRLADEVVAMARDAGFFVAATRCHELEGAPALWPWVQIARQLTEALDAGDEAAQLLQPGRPLASMLSGLARSEAGPTASASDRFALFDALVALLRRRSLEAPVLVLIDDLHWSDPASVILLRYAVRELRDQRIFFLSLYRDGELPEAAPLSSALAELAFESEAYAVEGLDVDEVREYVNSIAGYELADVFHAALRAHTGGNPLFMIEVIRMLVAEDRLGSPDAAMPDSIPLPASVRKAIERRVAGLEAAHRRTLIQASLLGRDFDADVLFATGISEAPVADALEAAVEIGLLERLSDRHQAYRFAHDVVRETLSHSIDAAERAGLHSRAARALLDMRSARLDEHYAQLVVHYLETARSEAAGSVEERRVAALAAHRFACLGAERASASFSFEVACALLEDALTALDLAGAGVVESSREADQDLAARGETLVRLADARWQSGLARAAEEADRAAERIARRRGDPVLLARAILGIAGRNDLPLDPPPQHARLLEEAIESLPREERVLRLRLLAQLVRSSSFGDRHAELVVWARECLEIADELDDPWARFIARDAMHYALLLSDRLAERLEIARGLPAMARELGSLRLEALALLWRIFDRLQVPDRAGADRDALRLSEIAGRLRRPFWQWLSLGVDACLALMDGDLVRAEKLIFEALEVGQRAATPNAILFFGTQLTHLRAAQGRADELLGIMEQIERERPALPVFRIGVPWIHALANREEAARRAFETVARDDFADVPMDFHRLPMLATSAHVAASLGDARRARVLRDALAPHRGQIVMAGVVTHWAGPVSRCLGWLDETLGDFESAAACHAEAADAAKRAGAPLHEAGALEDRARVLRAIGDAASRGTADRIEERARAIHARLGLEPPTTAVPRVANGAAAPASASREPAPPIRRGVFSRRDHSWQLSLEAPPFELPDSKGLEYLHRLVSAPDEEIHVLDLVAHREGATPDVRAAASEEGSSRARAADMPLEVLDESARRSYRERLRALAEDRARAEAGNDLGRLASIDAEVEALESELRAATGLGGRARATHSTTERARKSVYNRIRAAIDRIRPRDEALARHFDRCITTGRTCAYRPDRRVDWRLALD